MTPTWSEITHMLIEMLQNPKTRKDATIELQRMAAMADAHVKQKRRDRQNDFVRTAIGD